MGRFFRGGRRWRGGRSRQQYSNNNYNRGYSPPVRQQPVSAANSFYHKPLPEGLPGSGGFLGRPPVLPRRAARANYQRAQVTGGIREFENQVAAGNAGGIAGWMYNNSPTFKGAYDKHINGIDANGNVVNRVGGGFYGLAPHARSILWGGAQKYANGQRAVNIVGRRMPGESAATRSQILGLEQAYKKNLKNDLMTGANIWAMGKEAVPAAWNQGKQWFRDSVPATAKAGLAGLGIMGAAAFPWATGAWNAGKAVNNRVQGLGGWGTVSQAALGDPAARTKVATNFAIQNPGAAANIIGNKVQKGFGNAWGSVKGLFGGSGGSAGGAPNQDSVGN